MIHFEIVKRKPVGQLYAALLPVIAIAITLCLTAVLILCAGASVPQAFSSLLLGAFGSKFNFFETCVGTAPLVFTGLSVAFAFRAKFWNIGAEGQFLAGALGVTAMAFALPPLPSWLGIIVLIFTGCICGGLFALIPAVLKTKLKVDDVVSTLLLNYLMYHLMGICLFGPLQMPGSSWPVTSSIPDAFVFPVLIAKTRFHLGIVLALAAVLVIWIIQRYTVLGYEIRAVGVSEKVAFFGGIQTAKITVVTALIAGGLAGLGGASEVLGIQHRLIMAISPGYGYTGVVVAMLAQLNPLGVLATAFFFSAIGNGADTMSRICHVPAYISGVIQGVSLIIMLVCLLFRDYSIKIRKSV
jgi:general nucleoside transport system permease protein